MAIQKSSTYKGVTADYWKIIVSNYDAVNLKSYVVLGLYLSQTTRESDVNNYLTSIDFHFDGLSMTLAEQYAKIKESKKDIKIITPEVRDGNNEIVTPAVTEETETNPFADGIDC